MKSITNYFTINQFLTLQNFTWGGWVEISNKTQVNKRVCEEILYIIDT